VGKPNCSRNDYYGDTVELPSYAELIKSEQYNNLSTEIVSVDVTNGGDGRMYIAIVQIRGKFGFNVGCGDLNELQEFANMILDQLLRPSS
jgi:hypothetical protein